MIKSVNVNQLLFSDLLEKESVDEVNLRLTGNNKRGKLILTGSRGCGKSTVLAVRENTATQTSDPAMLVSFEGTGLFGSKENRRFNRTVMEHYYEVIMCNKFLNYVKKYYPQLYTAKFSRFEDTIVTRLDEIDRYLSNYRYTDVDLREKLFSGEALSEMCSVFRSCAKADTLTLMIDRFDWTHNSDPRVQKILSNYFTMFEKVIITSDDSTLLRDKKKKANLDKSGYEIVVMDYGCNIDTVKKIVEARFKVDGDEIDNFPVEFTSDEEFRKIVEVSGGNIDTVLDIFRYAEIIHNWDFKGDCSTVLDDASQEKTSLIKQFRKMYKKPKFHL